jgi:hypothetical protein
MIKIGVILPKVDVAPKISCTQEVHVYNKPRPPTRNPQSATGASSHCHHWLIDFHMQENDTVESRDYAPSFCMLALRKTSEGANTRDRDISA